MSKNSMYPHISLNIVNFKPTITFHPEEGMSRQLTLDEVNIADIIIELAKRLDLLDEILKKINDKMLLIENLLDIARNAADINKVEKYPDINVENNEFEIEKTLFPLLDEVIENRNDFSNIANLSPELENELIRDENADIFASLLEAMYSILIANTILAASQIGIGKIKLNDTHHNIRLLERMAQELKKLDIELLLD
jgi:hydrogenase maturation factor HypF (carbamoyltransferase family)